MILVTGAGGFIGFRLVEALAEEHEVRGLIHDAAEERRVRAAGAEVHVGDVTDPASLDGAFDDVERVVHLAAVIRPPARFGPVNVEGSRNVVEAAKAAGVDRFVQMSVLGADPDADHPYLASRGRAEQAVRDAGIDAAVVRASLVYGPGDHVVSLLSEMAQGPVTPVPGDGRVRLAPIRVEDAVACLVRIVEGDRTGLVEIGGPDALSYEELVEAVVARVNPRSRVMHVPRPLAKVGAWFMQMRGQETSPQEIDLLLAGDSVPGDNAAPGLVDELVPPDVGLNYLGPTGAYGQPDLVT